MNGKSEKLIKDFEQFGWQTEQLYERLFELTSNSEDIYNFATQFLLKFNQGTTIFDDSLCYLNKGQFNQLVLLSLELLKQNKNDNAGNVILYASLQFPDLLYNHLDLILEINPNEESYDSNFIWRNLPSERINVLKHKIQENTSSLTEKQQLFKFLLWTRDLKAIRFAYEYAIENKLFKEKGLELESYLIDCIQEVGFTLKNGKLVSYCPNPTKHFSFPKNYFDNDTPIHLSKEQHPTWILKPNQQKFKFGGLIENNLNNPFLHLITFDPLPHDLKITGLDKLSLGLHIRELNEFGAIFYEHKISGEPMKIGPLKEIEIFDNLPIRETQVSLADTPSRWQFQDWGSSNGRENLFRFGGEPTWIQYAEIPLCPICNEKMYFLMQIDSELPDIENGEVFFGSGGICYVFWCDKTKVSGYIMQCT